MISRHHMVRATVLFFLAAGLTGCSAETLGGPAQTTDTSQDAATYTNSVQSGMVAVGQDYQAARQACDGQWHSVVQGDACYLDLVTTRTTAGTYLANLTTLTPPDDQVDAYTTTRAAMDQIVAGNNEVLGGIDNNDQDAMNSGLQAMQTGGRTLRDLGYDVWVG